MYIMYFCIYLILGFGGMYGLLYPQANKYVKTLKPSLTMLFMPYIYIFYALGIVSAYYLLSNNDFVGGLHYKQIVVPLILAAAIYFSFFIFSLKLSFLTVVLSVVITVLLQPIENGSPWPELPIWGVQIIAVIFGVLFCYALPILNGIPHTFVVPNIFILMGLLILSFIGASPVFIGLCAAITIGALGGYLAVNYYSVKLELDMPTLVTISFLVCNLLLMNIGEFCFPSCIIFTLPIFAEFMVAVWRYFVTKRSGQLSENTNSYQAALKYPLNVLLYGIAKIYIISLFIGWFQLFSQNGYSLIVVAFLLSFWLNSLIGEPTNKSLKQLNKEFVANVKQNIEDAKDVLNRKD